MAWCVYYCYFIILVRDIEGTNLLSNTTMLVFGNVGVSKEVQQCCFTMVDMTHDGDDWWSFLHQRFLTLVA